MPDLIVSVVPAVELAHGQPTVTSLAVGEHFRRAHKNVLRDIKELDCSESFRRLNFEPSPYVNSQGKEQPAIRMTRDGFVFLVMGYTGPQAARLKEAYIQRFNEMEARLRVAPAELDYLRRRERELVSSLRRNVRLQGRVIRLQAQLLRERIQVVAPPSNQPDLFGGAR